LPATVRIGISGWRYGRWRGVFYPRGLAQHRELAFASRMFPTIEINGSHYSLQRPETYQAWHDETPDDFVFAVKGPRYITHMLRLRELRAPLANFLASGLFALGRKLGPMLWQFPPSFAYDEAQFDAFFRLLPHDTDAAAALARAHDERLDGRALVKPRVAQPLRHAVEIRHASFVDPGFIALLRQHGVALVVADTAGRWPLMEDLTADFVYVRLHGDQELYASGYGDAALDDWAARVRAWRGGRQHAGAHVVPGAARGPRGARDVYAYLDNDVKVHAPFDAGQLAARLNVPTGQAADGGFPLPAEWAGRPRR
jgi:uncharacterized protein YecE (DUF72 family)